MRQIPSKALMNSVLPRGKCTCSICNWNEAFFKHHVTPPSIYPSVDWSMYSVRPSFKSNRRWGMNLNTTWLSCGRFFRKVCLVAAFLFLIICFYNTDCDWAIWFIAFVVGKTSQEFVNWKFPFKCQSSWVQYEKYCAGSSQAVSENMDRGGEWAHWHVTEQVHTHTYIHSHFWNSVCYSAGCDFFCDELCCELSDLTTEQAAHPRILSPVFYFLFCMFYELNVSMYFQGNVSIGEAAAALCKRQGLLFTDEHACAVSQSSFSQWWCIIRAPENCSRGEEGYELPQSLLQARGSVQVWRLGHYQHWIGKPCSLIAYEYKCSHESLSHGFLLDETWRSALYNIHLLNEISVSLRMISRMLQWKKLW